MAAGEDERSPAPSPRSILVATRSAGKMRELRRLFTDAGINALSLDDAKVGRSSLEDSLESEDTYVANALAKALYFHRLSGMPTVADDSGLEVVALGGAPGVYSKRWSARAQLEGVGLDAANNALLLERLEGVADRRARYVCAAALCDGVRTLVEHGETPGLITSMARGSNGFGYDPYFESTELGRTFGEVSLDEKARVSHRARAFAKLLLHLQKNVPGAG